MNLPYSPIHSKAWLERYLKKNYFKKKYDRYMWWRSYTLRNPPLSNKHPLRDRIINGDFDLGPFIFEIELVEHRINEKSLSHKHEDTFREDIQLDKARRKRLIEDRDKDEHKKLRTRFPPYQFRGPLNQYKYFYKFYSDLCREWAQVHGSSVV